MTIHKSSIHERYDHQMHFAVFSYNRGPYLRNCIKSIEACAPDCNISIYDDGSDDQGTIDILDEIELRHKVYRTPFPAEKLHGGLYNNMQRALESVHGDQIVVFLQDDTQLVRPVMEKDVDFIRHYFDSNENAGFLAPVFLRNITSQKTLDDFHYVAELGVYICRHDTGKCAGIYYSDISITTSRRLRDNGWVFQDDEMKNEEQAREMFMEMGYMYAPFAMWLPNIPAYRHRQKPLAYRIAEFANRSGLYPYKYMTHESIQRLTNRSPIELAIAEDYFDTIDKQVRKPWIFHPLKRSRILRNIDRIDRYIRKLLNPDQSH